MQKAKNGKSSIFVSIREGASPAESVPYGKNVKCVRELMGRTCGVISGKCFRKRIDTSISIRETAVICYQGGIVSGTIQLEWNRGFGRLLFLRGGLFKF